MIVRLLTTLLTAAAALWAMAPAAAAGGGGGEPAAGGKDVPNAKGTAPTATAEQPGPVQDPSSADQTSTSPGGTAPGSGTQTTGPGAPAPPEQGTVGTGVALACDPQAAVRRALRSLRRASRRRDLLTPRARSFTVRVRPCVPGTFALRIADRRSGAVLWRARRELRTTRRAKLRMTMTRRGRRLAKRGTRGRKVPMRLHATLRPYGSASLSASISPSTS